MPDTADPPSERRPLYTHADLLPLLRPSSVAVVGASETKENFGTLALRRLLESGFAGEIVVVHPKAAETTGTLHGVRAVASLRELRGGVDCVLVAVPATAAETVVRDAAGSGCRSAIVFSAGFAEIGEEGLAAQSRILATARESGLRLGGPNTAGILNYRDALPLTFVSDLAMHLPVGTIGIVSQSGGLATHLGHVRHRGIGMSYTITTGNSVDVGPLDYVNFLLEDEGTDVVILALEGLSDPEAFARLGAKSLAVGKPIVTIKSGRTAAGGQAAVSHTGSLAGDHEVFLAAARQAGIQVVQSTVEAIETATMYSRWADRPYRPGGVGIVTTMGGPGVLAADAAADAGVDLPRPSPRTVRRLGELVPAFATVGNPIDTTASPPDPVLTEVITAVGEDPAFSATVILAASMTGPSTAGRPAAIAAAGSRLQTPLAAVWLSSWAEGPGTEILDADPRIPLFRSSDRAMRALARWRDWHERMRAARTCAQDRAGKAGPVLEAAARQQVRTLVEKFAGASEGAIDEAGSRELLIAAGIDVPRAQVVTSAAAAGEAATAMGFPVVAKVVSADVPHKAAAGGVLLGLRTADQVADAYTRIVDAVSSARPDATLDGVLVAESLETRLELMCGLIRDPVFGPVVVCGAGGGAVELINDAAQMVAPFTEENALAAARRLRILSRLRRTDAATATRAEAALAGVMLRLAALAEVAPEIGEIDVNPVVLRPDGTPVALDGLAILRTEEGTP